MWGCNRGREGHGGRENGRRKNRKEKEGGMVGIAEGWGGRRGDGGRGREGKGVKRGKGRRERRKRN